MIWTCSLSPLKQFLLKEEWQQQVHKLGASPRSLTSWIFLPWSIMTESTKYLSLLQICVWFWNYLLYIATTLRLMTFEHFCWRVLEMQQPQCDGMANDLHRSNKKHPCHSLPLTKHMTQLWALEGSRKKAAKTLEKIWKRQKHRFF